MPRFPLVIAAAMLTLAGVQTAANAQGMSYSLRSYPPREDPAVNVYLSAQYDNRLETNWRFRRYRMWKECHIINWVPLHGDCIASFDQYEPFRGGW